MIRVGVNGYGTIGKRVADAVALQPDMELLGVAKTSPNAEAAAAIQRGYGLYAPAEYAGRFESMPLEGTLEELVAEADAIVDTTPSGIGAKNRSLYAEHDTPAIFQGGEDADVADMSFVASETYEEARGARTARVVSCNTTGLSRVLGPLDREFGVERARATLIRRGGDATQPNRGPINDSMPDPPAVPSHHGPDVREVLPDVDVDTMAVKVPTTLMHLHAVNVSLESEPAPDDVRSLLDTGSRVALVPGDAGIDGCAHLREAADDRGRPRGDVWENCVWESSVTVRDADLYFFQAIHQESDVVPENVDAIRALAGDASAAASVARTNEALGVGFELFPDSNRQVAGGVQ
jgi:glyceraldehyde-3-phosphate dehydrogenase (NAD(P))